MVRVGTAGWSIPAASVERVPHAGTHLERYATTLSCVEINSTFYRSHRAATYERWARSVPADFAFALKIPKEITHVRRLAGCADEVARFLAQSEPLGAKRAVLLVQLPPTFAYCAQPAASFFATLRQRYAGRIACEPRNATWFTDAADEVLSAHGVVRVAADPARDERAARPGGCRGFTYYRWHGAPRTYYSSYDAARLATLAQRLAAEKSDAWCIFDNTASGAAFGNALAVASALRDLP